MRQWQFPLNNTQTSRIVYLSDCHVADSPVFVRRKTRPKPGPSTPSIPRKPCGHALLEKPRLPDAGALIVLRGPDATRRPVRTWGQYRRSRGNRVFGIRNLATPIGNTTAAAPFLSDSDLAPYYLGLINPACHAREKQKRPFCPLYVRLPSLRDPKSSTPSGRVRPTSDIR